MAATGCHFCMGESLNVTWHCSVQMLFCKIIIIIIIMMMMMMMRKKNVFVLRSQKGMFQFLIFKTPWLK